MRYVLDTSAITAAPELLRLIPSSDEVILPDVVLEELQQIAQTNHAISAVLRYVEGSARRPNINIYAAPVRWQPLEISEHRVPTDSLILNVLQVLQQDAGTQPILVSEDRDLLRRARDRGYTVTRSRDLQDRFEADAPRVAAQRVDSDLAALRRSLRRYRIANIATAAGALFAVFGIRYAQFLETANVWGTVAALPLAGCLLFAIRQRLRLGYGLAEFIIGLATGVNVFWPTFS